MGHISADISIGGQSRTAIPLRVDISAAPGDRPDPPNPPNPPDPPDDPATRPAEPPDLPG